MDQCKANFGVGVIDNTRDLRSRLRVKARKRIKAGPSALGAPAGKLIA